MRQDDMNDDCCLKTSINNKMLPDLVRYRFDGQSFRGMYRVRTVGFGLSRVENVTVTPEYESYSCFQPQLLVQPLETLRTPCCLPLFDRCRGVVVKMRWCGLVW